MTIEKAILTDSLLFLPEILCAYCTKQTETVKNSYSLINQGK